MSPRLPESEEGDAWANPFPQQAAGERIVPDGEEQDEHPSRGAGSLMGQVGHGVAGLGIGAAEGGLNLAGQLVGLNLHLGEPRKKRNTVYLEEIAKGLYGTHGLGPNANTRPTQGSEWEVEEAPRLGVTIEMVKKNE